MLRQELDTYTCSYKAKPSSSKLLILLLVVPRFFLQITTNAKHSNLKKKSFKKNVNKI